MLKGAVNFLNRTNYPPLLFEAWNFDWFKEDRENLISFVKNLGYEIIKLGPSDYIAQHPKNAVRIEFTKTSEGAVKMAKVK